MKRNIFLGACAVTLSMAIMSANAWSAGHGGGHGGHGGHGGGHAGHEGHGSHGHVGHNGSHHHTAHHNGHHAHGLLAFGVTYPLRCQELNYCDPNSASYDAANCGRCGDRQKGEVSESSTPIHQNNPLHPQYRRN